jgi:multidrug efflux pump subunit AcrA (membrane-fusion protein)
MRPMAWPLGAAMALVSFVIVACGPAAAAKPAAQPPRVSVVTVQRSGVSTTIELPGHTSASLASTTAQTER